MIDHGIERDLVRGDDRVQTKAPEPGVHPQVRVVLALETERGELVEALEGLNENLNPRLHDAIIIIALVMIDQVRAADEGFKVIAIDMHVHIVGTFLDHPIPEVVTNPKSRICGNKSRQWAPSLRVASSR